MLFDFRNSHCAVMFRLVLMKINNCCWRMLTVNRAQRFQTLKESWKCTITWFRVGIIISNDITIFSCLIVYHLTRLFCWFCFPTTFVCLLLLQCRIDLWTLFGISTEIHVHISWSHEVTTYLRYCCSDARETLSTPVLNVKESFV